MEVPTAVAYDDILEKTFVIAKLASEAVSIY